MPSYVSRSRPDGRSACSSAAGTSQWRKRRWCQLWCMSGCASGTSDGEMGAMVSGVCTPHIVVTSEPYNGRMKHAPVALLAACLLAACSSSDNNKNATLLKPELALEQLVGPSELGYPRGRIDVQFALHIGNRSGEPITVRRVEIGTVSTGAYALRRESFVFDKQIPPGGVDAATFGARG